MNFEQLNLQPAGPEKGEFKERLSVEYGFIRDAARRLVEQKMKLAADELGDNSLGLNKFEEAKAKLADDQYVLSFARENNWQKMRDESEDLEEDDRILAKKLADSVLGVQ